MKISSYVVFAAAIGLLSCGGGESEPATAASETQETAAASAPESVALEISSNDMMQFDKKELKAKAGQKVTLTLHHTGKASKEVMGHNVVILKPDVNIPDFGMKAVDAKDNDYIPASEEANIIAHTKIIGGGESTSVEFTAPEPGIYIFICSFPGHFAAMQGTFIVE
ncbi:MAG TPA: azurin [Flavitalea sp.]|nr:azurin [Flavitalea sp.]